MREFDWLEGCVSCNKECCHNTNKHLSPKECIYVDNTSGGEYFGTSKRIQETKDNASTYDVSANDNRPLECRLFPFDIKIIDGKTSWIIYDSCHEVQKLNYERVIDFFERKFFREIPIEQIKLYATGKSELLSHKYPKPEVTPLRGYKTIREVSWPSE